ncbi:beta strand repeat-containing protein [Tautonia plasticadhaerens]|uniref:Calx-beta domain protein n=1 Tax=Tautonia plasticadhaerens TaxID=2527974 RepID=A0A518HEG5_9BACT|nr:Calx-beta domain-containing protein [Tautonia plasticadhaerens]QDV39156.1 Calx-beta domain protein [Tautonia plasticadhaerens]
MAAVGVEFRVNTFTSGTQQTHPESPRAVAMDADGDFVVVWTSDGQDGGAMGVYGQRYNTLGVPQGSEFRINATSAGSQSNATVAMDADGNFAVTWTSDQDGLDDIYARGFDADGTPRTDEFRVNAVTADHQDRPSVAMGADGDFVITWTSGGDHDGDSTGIYARRFDAAGTPKGGEFQVNTQASQAQADPRIAMDPAGNFVVVWASNLQDGDSWGIYGQRFDAAGVPRGGEFRVNSVTADVQQDASVAMDALGNLVVAWGSNFQDGDGWGVYARRFDAAGAAQGGELQVNTVAAGDQRFPAVAMAPDGRFLIAYQGLTQDPSADAGVYLRQYTAAGVAQGVEARVPTTTLADQLAPSVATTGGKAVVVWSGSGTGDPDGVFGQRLVGPGFTVSPQAGLQTTEAGGTATFTVVLDAAPTADVTIALSSTNTAEGTVSPSSMTFTPADWDAPRTVSVTGVNDAIRDGDRLFSIVLGAATGADPLYNGLDPADVRVANRDDEPGVSTNGFWLSTTDDVPSPSGAPGLSSWGKDEVISFGGPSLALEPGTTAGSFLSVFRLDLLADDGNAEVDAIHHVSRAVTVGGAHAIALQPGDLLLSTGTNEAFLGGTFVVDEADLFLFRPNTPGDYSSGTFRMVLDESSAGFGASFGKLWGIALVERATTVGDVTLNAGDFLYSRDGGAEDHDVWLFRPSDVGRDTTSGTHARLVEGDQVGINPKVFGIDLVSETATYGGRTLAAGTLLLSLDGEDNSVGNGTPIAVTRRDVFALQLSQTTLGSGTATGTASLVFQGGDVGLDTNKEAINALTLVSRPGIAVTPTSGLTTSEAGGTASFSVRLLSQPTADVTIPVSTSDSTEGAPSVASLTFTPANWNVAQTVTVVGVDDFLADGPVGYTIVLGLASGLDPGYNGVDPADVSLTNADNDVPGVTVTPITGLTTTEAGGTATFSVSLRSMPLANVTIAVATSDATEGIASVSSITFTPANWNVPQSVTVTGVDDPMIDGPIAYSIVLGAASSLDLSYNGLDPSDVALTNADDDVAGFLVTPTSGLTTTEAGGTASFSVRLLSQPTADVTIPVSTSDPTEGTPSVTSLTFTPANWNVAQTVTVAGVDDLDDDGDAAYSILLGAASGADPLYNGLDPADVALTNVDDDAAGILVSPVTNLTTSEAGGTASFSVMLASRPAAPVTIAIVTSDPTEGIASAASLTFTPADWNIPRFVTVAGVDDPDDDGDVAYSIVLGLASSFDPLYNGLDPADVAAVNADDDTAGVVVAPMAGLTTSEAGGSASFSVVLTSRPAADVTITVATSDPTEGVPSAASLTFTPADWNVARAVTIVGSDDSLDDGDVTYTIVLGPATSLDPLYNGLDPADVAAVNADDDTAGVVVAPMAGLTTSEAGDTASFSVVLTSQPSADVTIPVSTSDAGAGVVSVSSLTFTPANWNVPQFVTVAGVDDPDDAGDTPYSILLSPASSADLLYNDLDPADVVLSNADDDATGIVVSPNAGLITTEAGGTASFSVVLASRPAAAVTIPVASGNPGEGVVSVSSLTFTSADWDTPQVVTIRGVDDPDDDGDVAYSIVLGLASSFDPLYNGLDPADVAAVNADDDTAGVVVAPMAGLTTSEAGGSASFSVVLTSRPAADVTITVATSDPTEGVPSAASLTFTPDDWDVPQAVTVVGIDDPDDDGDVHFAVLLSPSSGDPAFDRLGAAAVTLENLDDDAAGVTIDGPSAGVVSEAGGTVSFAIRLDSRPSAAVTITLVVSDPGEGAVSTATLRFSPDGWDRPQSFTVSGADDPQDDGDAAFTVTLLVASDDPAYGALPGVAIPMANLDDDEAALVVAMQSAPVTTEAGGTARLSVRLASAPTAEVVVVLVVDDPSAAAASPVLLRFTPDDWDIPQLVTLTGLDDGLEGGDRPYTVSARVSSTADPAYLGRSSVPILLLNAQPPAPEPPPEPPSPEPPDAPAPEPPDAPAPEPPTPGPTSPQETPGEPKPDVPPPVDELGNVPQPPIALALFPSLGPPQAANPVRLPPVKPLTLASDGADEVSSNQAGTASAPSANRTYVDPEPEPADPAPEPEADPGQDESPGEQQAGPASRPAEQAAVEVSAPAPILAATGPAPSPTATQASAPAAGRERAEAVAMAVDHLFSELDRLGQELEEGADPLPAASVAAVGVLASVGYVLLAGRPGLWLLGALGVGPIWRQFDPLDVIFAWEQQQRRRREERGDDEESLQSIAEGGRAAAGPVRGVSACSD